MKSINSLLVFLKNANLTKEAFELEKLATPFIAPSLPKKERAELEEETKKILPKIYISENLYIKDVNEIPELRSIVEKNNLFSGIPDINSRVEKLIKAAFEAITNQLSMKFIMSKDGFVDSFETRNLPMTKMELAEAFYKPEYYDGLDPFGEAYSLISKNILSKISKLPKGFDFYHLPMIYVDFNTTKEFIYHDVLGHSFEPYLEKFVNHIEKYLAETVEQLDDEYGSYGKSPETIHRLYLEFIDGFGIEDSNSVFNNSAAIDLSIATDIEKEDSYFDLFSLILKDKIKITPPILPPGMGDLDKQNKINKLSSDLENNLNNIKEEMISNINKKLNQIKNKRYILQFLDL